MAKLNPALPFELAVSGTDRVGMKTKPPRQFSRARQALPRGQVILSDDLAPGQRLPSTRELARRFRLHPNTVSAGYRQLERERWVEFRHGSGVYVGERKPELAPSSALALDQLIL